MKAFVSYAGVLALGLAVGSFVHGSASLENIGRLAWLDQAHAIINAVFTPAKPDPALAFVDEKAAALLDEELDYRIAERTNSVEGWRSFLTAHESGAYAPAASAEVETLLRAEEPPAQAEASNDLSPDAKAGNAVAAPPAAPATEVVALAPDEIGDREGVQQQPANEEAAPIANDWRREKLQREPMGLVDAPDQPASRPAVEHPSPAALKAATTFALTWRPPQPPERPRATVSSRGAQPKRDARACPEKAACLWRGREELFAVNGVERNPSMAGMPAGRALRSGEAAL